MASHRVRALALTALIAGSSLIAAPPALAQQDEASQKALEEQIAMLRGDLKARRDSAVDALITLDADGAKKFRPLKDAYDADLKKIIDRRVALIGEFAKNHDRLTAPMARDMAERLFKIESDRLTLQKTYFDRMSAEISPIVAVQFMQLQRQFEAMGEVKAATLTPMAKD